MFKKYIIQFDTVATRRIQGWGAWLRTPMLAATTLGHPVVLILAASLTIAGAWHSNAVLAAAMATAITAMIINSLLKHFIHRTRPDTLYVSHMYFKTSSFPSGHAFGATVILGLIGYAGWPVHAMVPPTAAVLIAAIGISRIYLGAHFPTDVLAGWIFGGSVLAAIITGFGL